MDVESVLSCHSSGLTLAFFHNSSQGLLVASAFSYERVTFNGVELPIRYEAVAWLAMVGPLCVVPFTALYTLYDAWKRRKSWKWVFSTANWTKAKKDEEAHQPQHPPVNDDYGLYSVLYSLLNLFSVYRSCLSRSIYEVTSEGGRKRRVRKTDGKTG